MNQTLASASSTGRRQISSLITVFSAILLVMVAAGVGGVALVDAVRGYVAGEGYYSKAQKAAVLALHRYADSRNPADFSEYRRQIEVPISDARAREILEDPARPREQSYLPFIGGNNHPDDVSKMAWFFRYFGETDLFAPAIQIWREADQKVAELNETAWELHTAIQAGTMANGTVDALLWRIDNIDGDLTELEHAFSRTMGEEARKLTAIIYSGIVGLGLALAAIAAAFAIHASRRIRNASRAIRQSEARFRDVAEVAADWIWEMDSQFRFTFLSDRLMQVSNLPKEHFLGRRRWDFNANPGPEGWAPHRQALERHESLRNFEYSVADATGQMRSFRISGRPVYNERGEFLGYRGTGTDVSAEVAARRQAEQRRELLEITFENLGQGVCVVDRDLNVAAFNERFMELLDFPPDRFSVGDAFEKFLRFNIGRGEYGKVEPEPFVRERLASIQDADTHSFERIRPNGTVLQVRGYPLPSGGFVTTYRDITAERKIQVDLEASEARTREVIDRALDAYISIDHNETIRDWNPAAESIFGWTREEALGRRLADLIMPERFKAKHHEALQNFLATGNGSFVGRRAELPALRRNGEEFSIELAISAQKIGTETVFNAFIRDITERKLVLRSLERAKTEAEASNRAKSEFLANMSHELRTPLNAIIGFSDIMLQKMMGPINNRYVEYAQDIHKSGEHLLALIADILDISSLEAGRVELHPEAVNLHELMANCASLVRRRADEGGVAVVNAIAENAPHLMVDRRRVQQILLNLIGNAVKFSPPSSVVQVRAALTDSALVLEVADQGVGMPQEEISRVFEPFVQLRSGAERSHEGTGLGLALVKRFAEMHGGHVTLESVLGQGTTVRVHFPRELVAEALPPVQQEKAGSSADAAAAE